MRQSWPTLPGWLGKEMEGFHNEILSTAQSTKGRALAGAESYGLLSWKESLFNLEQQDLEMRGICVHLGKCLGEGGK